MLDQVNFVCIGPFVHVRNHSFIGSCEILDSKGNTSLPYSSNERNQFCEIYDTILLLVLMFSWTLKIVSS